MTSKVVLILRRKVDDARPEVEALRQAYPEMELEFQVVHPTNYLEHATICEERNSYLVVLPKDRPIPSLAMEQGVRHVAIINGELMELVAIKPEFKPFVP